MTPWLLLLAAIVSNVSLNLCLKSVSGLLSPAPVATMVTRVLFSPYAWLAIFFAAALVICFTLAIRTLPLSLSYAVITGGAIASLATIGFMLGTESLSVLQLSGVALVISGIALVTLAS